MATLDRAKKLQDRTKRFAIRIIHAFNRLPKSEAARIIGRQFLRSGTSVAANYCAACRARSAADFISKIRCSSGGSRRNTFLARAVSGIRSREGREGGIFDNRMRGARKNIFSIARDGES